MSVRILLGPCYVGENIISTGNKTVSPNTAWRNATSCCSFFFILLVFSSFFCFYFLAEHSILNFWYLDCFIDIVYIETCLCCTIFMGSTHSNRITVCLFFVCITYFKILNFNILYQVSISLVIANLM